MTKNPKRALRRHHVARRKRWAARELAHIVEGHQGRSRRKTVGLLAETPKRCSCWMCGNPRRHFGEPSHREVQDKLDE